jgi:rhodanese-related sulfurtransferase
MPHQSTARTWRLRQVAVGILTLALAGCTESAGRDGGTSSETPPAATQAHTDASTPDMETLPTHMSPAQVRQALHENPEILLLDVRQPEELAQSLGSIEGSRLIPLPELGQRVGEIEAWRDRPVITVCRSGRRSEAARKALVQAGFTNVANLDGGMIEWRKTE